MAVFDTPRTMLAQAVDSILRQTYRDFEFLILDDGSSDLATRASLRCVADPRVRVLWEPHRGLTATLNRGLERAEGRLIARQDADDWSDPGRLARQVPVLERCREIALCGTDAWTHQCDGQPLWPTHLPSDAAQVRRAFPTGNPFVHGAVLFRRAEALAAGGYREEFHCSQDYDFFWRLADRWSAVNLPEPLYHYRYNGGAISAKRAIEQAAAHLAAGQLAEARKHGRPECVALALDDARRAVAAGRGRVRAELKQADHRLLAGDYQEAGRAYGRVLRSNPLSPLAWGKLARWGLFRAIPPARELAFRH
jgi:glycosyltransferase involved in cell wall biosynthesis